MTRHLQRAHVGHDAPPVIGTGHRAFAGTAAFLNGTAGTMLGSEVTRVFGPEGLPDHTIYHPADLSNVKGRMPILTYGNGGCINIDSLSQTFLGQIASHGYLVIAAGPIGPEPVISAPSHRRHRSRVARASPRHREISA